MGFFAQFFTWLNTQLSTYIGSNTAQVAAAIEPAAITLATIYVMLWGWMNLQGLIQEQVLQGIKRILVMALILGIGIRLWLYNDLVVNTFYTAPDQLAAALVGAPSTVGIIDQVWTDGNKVAEELLKKGSVLSGDFAYYLAGFFVYLLIGLTVVYTAFLLAMSKVALAVIIALGPIFIVLLFFDSTKRFFEAWIAQLANYALITILSLLVAALMLSIVRAYATAAMSQGSGITIAESARLCIAVAVATALDFSAAICSAAALASSPDRSPTVRARAPRGADRADQHRAEQPAGLTRVAAVQRGLLALTGCLSVMSIATVSRVAVLVRAVLR